MNNAKRKMLCSAIQCLSEADSVMKNLCSQTVTQMQKAKMLTEAVNEKEEDALANYPENFQYTDRYEAMERAIDLLTEATEKIEDAIDCVTNAAR